jgi:hypothetical protein
MQKFEYRSPRYVVDLPVLFKLPGGAIPGRCKEIGKEGMKVELEQPVAPGSSGAISINYREVSLELRVTVAHAASGFDGLKFLFESEKDRSGVERLVALLSAPSEPAPLPAPQRPPVLPFSGHRKTPRSDS